VATSAADGFQVLSSATAISRREPQICAVSLTCPLGSPAYACSVALLQASLAAGVTWPGHHGRYG
jgi:hypothetical protein